MGMLPEQPRRALVITVVHDPRDSRIWFRQIDALLRRGWHVTYAAPFSEERSVATEHLDPDATRRLRLVTLPRARGRSRISAAMGARQLLRREGNAHNIVLIHDPELLMASFGLQLPHLVWDVHEDTAVALAQKQWLPAALRRPTARVVRYVERWAEKRFTLLLAETSYQRRFRYHHTVVPNAVIVPDRVEPVGGDRVVYLGSLTPARGSDLLPTIGRLLKDRTSGAVTLEVIGPTYDDDTTRVMLEAHANGDLVWRGFLPADEAMQRVRGALAGLSLLRDAPNFRHSMPTKVVEYCAYGVPVITTPLPIAAQLVERSGSGYVVPWDSPQDVVNAVVRLFGKKSAAKEMGLRGHRVAATEYDWERLSQVFVDELESVAVRTASLTINAGSSLSQPGSPAPETAD